MDEKENDDSFLDEETLKFGAMLRGLEAEQDEDGGDNDDNDDSEDEPLSLVERMNAIRSLSLSLSLSLSIHIYR